MFSHICFLFFFQQLSSIINYLEKVTDIIIIISRLFAHTQIKWFKITNTIQGELNRPDATVFNQIKKQKKHADVTIHRVQFCQLFPD